MRNFTFESYVDDENAIKHLAFYKGKSCSSKVIEGMISKRRKSLQLIIMDLVSCFEYISLIETIKNSSLEQALYKAFIVTYGKCFVSGNTRGLSLDECKIFINSEEKWKNHHGHIMKLRNTYIAHSDSETLEQAEVYLISSSNEEEIFCPTLKYSHPIDYSLDKERQLCQYVYENVENQISKVDNNLINKNV